MFRMGTLNDENKVTFRSVREASRVIDDAVHRLRYDDEVRYLPAPGKKPKRANMAAVATALLLSVGKLPWEEQRRMIAEGMADLNRILAGGDAGGRADDAAEETKRQAVDPRKLDLGEPRKRGAL